MRVHCCFQDVQFFELLESEHAFEVIARDADFDAPLFDVHYDSFCHYDVLAQIETHEDFFAAI